MFWRGYRAAIILKGRHDAEQTIDMHKFINAFRCLNIEPYGSASLEGLEKDLQEDGATLDDLDLLFVHAEMGDLPELYGKAAGKVGLLVHMPSGTDEELARWEGMMGRPYGEFLDGTPMFIKKEGYLSYLPRAVNYFMAMRLARLEGESGSAGAEPGPE